MEKERVSVVIPVYNGEEFIVQAVNSVLNQTYKNIEIVIVDDHSTDNTQEVIFERFSEILGKKIIYHRNDKNMERAFSRNKGVEISSGKYIFFLDADDEWENDYIQHVLNIFLKKNPDIVYSFPRLFIDEHNKIIKVSKKPILQDIGEVIFSSMIGYPTATAVKREKYLKYIDKYIPREDWEFFIRAFLNGLDIEIDDNKKVKIREHSSRTSSTKCFYYSTLKVYEDYKDCIPIKYRSHFYYHLSEVSLRFGELRQGIKFLLKALKSDPKTLFKLKKIGSIMKRLVRIDRFLGYNIKECNKK